MYSSAMAARETGKRRDCSITFMPMPQQRKSHMTNETNNSENVKEQDLNMILAILLCCSVLLTYFLCL